MARPRCFRVVQLRTGTDIVDSSEKARRDGLSGAGLEREWSVSVKRGRLGIGRHQVKSQGIQLFEVDGGELLRGCAVVEFVERIVGTLHAAIEKVAGIG